MASFFADAVEAKLRFPMLKDGRAHHRHVAHVLDALGLAIHDEHRRATRTILRRPRHHDQERRVTAARRVPLVSVDDPRVAVLAGARLQVRRIGTRARCRLGHREAARDLAPRERTEPPLAHARRRRAQQQIHVALIGRIAVEARRADRRAPHLAEERAHAHDPETEAAVLLGEVRHEEARLARLLPKGIQRVAALGPVLLEDLPLVRHDMVVHEGANADAKSRKVGGQVEADHASRIARETRQDCGETEPRAW